jgi:hypothetical protein
VVTARMPGKWTYIGNVRALADACQEASQCWFGIRRSKGKISTKV